MSTENQSTLPDPAAMPDGQEFYAVRVYVCGVRKRCRKVERRGFKLANVTLSTRDNPGAIEQVKKAAWLRIESEMKSLSPHHGEPYLTFSYSQIKGEMLEERPFDDRNFKLSIGWEKPQ